jgi:integrase
MASFLTPHPKAGWRYQRHIPKELRPMLGGRTTSVKYIPAMSRRDAEKQARAFATQDDELWSKLRQLSATEAAHLASSGGLDKVRQSAPDLEFWLRVWRHQQTTFAGMDPRKTIREYGQQIGIDPARLPDEIGPEKTALMMYDGLRGAKDRERQTLEALQRHDSVLRKLIPQASEFSLDGLFQLWIKVREPRLTHRHDAIIKKFRDVIGDVDYRLVTQADIAKFRDHLATLQLSKESQGNYLTRLKALFSAAVNANKIATNPAAGVNVFGKKPRLKASEDRPFTGAEVRLILEKAEATKLGGQIGGRGKERHTEIMWMLRLLAWTGARPNEIAQLRKCDAGVDNGVSFIHIREGHPEQSVKTGDSRKVPLHKAVADFVSYAHKADDFVFAAFPYNRINGRAAWLKSIFGRFLRQTCEVTEDSKTLYSLRHRFIDATRNAGVSEEMSKALTGHSTGDVHGRYGKGFDLRVLAEAMAKVNPLAD